MLYICQKGRPYIGKLTSNSPHSNNTYCHRGNSFCLALLESIGYPTTSVCIVSNANTHTSKKCPLLNFVYRALYRHQPGGIGAAPPTPPPPVRHHH